MIDCCYLFWYLLSTSKCTHCSPHKTRPIILSFSSFHHTICVTHGVNFTKSIYVRIYDAINIVIMTPFWLHYYYFWVVITRQTLLACCQYEYSKKHHARLSFDIDVNIEFHIHTHYILASFIRYYMRYWLDTNITLFHTDIDIEKFWDTSRQPRNFIYKLWYHIL